MIALLMLVSGRQVLAADQKKAAAAAGAGALAVAKPVASTTAIDYENLLTAYGYTQALTSKPAGIGAAAGFLVSRAVKASAPATLAIVAGGHAAGAAYDAVNLIQRVQALRDKEKREAQSTFDPLRHFSYLAYGVSLPVHSKIDDNLYAKMVEQSVISCVDVFVYNPETKTYLRLVRKDKPAQGKEWIPGGRLCFGEDFYVCAQRKCKAETGLQVNPIANLGSYSTVFPDSQWGCQTHSANTAVLALVEAGQNVSFDEHHEQARWVSISEKPQEPYIQAIHARAVTHLAKTTK